MAGEFNFNKKMQRFRELRNTLPTVIANTGQRHFQQEFQRSQWNGVAWKLRKDATNTKHLLVASGALKQSLQNSIRYKGTDYVEWGNDLPYGAVHNYGYAGRQRVRSRKGKMFMRTMNIPQRKFMGDSPLFRSLLKKKIALAYKNIFAK